MAILRLDPALRISTRRGQILAWLPAQARPRILSAHTVERLSAVLAGLDPTGLPPEELRDLREAGLLVPPSAEHRAAPEAVDLPVQHPSISELPGLVRQVSQACLFPGEREFVAWSPSLRAYCRLPGVLALRLLAAGEGRAVPELLAGLAPGSLEEARGRAGVAQLLAAGLLVPATAARTRPVASTSPIETEAGHLGEGDPWAGLQPDGRTPIYFVTHHADHLPLALGMLRAHLMAHRGGELLRQIGRAHV